MVLTQSLVRNIAPNFRPFGRTAYYQNLMTAYRNYRDRCQTNQKLAMLSDHLLSDIGTSRREVSTISGRDQQLFQDVDCMGTQLMYLRLR